MSTRADRDHRCARGMACPLYVPEYVPAKEEPMREHSKSQHMAESIMVGAEISSPGVQAVVLAKGTILPAGKGAYAGVYLLTLVKNNPFQPFRIATWWFQDDGRGQGWQSGSGQSYMADHLTEAVRDFAKYSGGRA